MIGLCDLICSNQSYRLVLKSMEFGDDFLDRLRAGDEAAWEDVFRWLWPAAVAKASVAGMRKCCPDDVEDVASKALSILIRKVKEGFAKKVDDLKALLSRITHDESISWCRGLFAQKRGGGKTESLEAMNEDEKSGSEPAIEDSPLAKLEIAEHGDLLRKAGKELKKRDWEILEDYFFSELKHDEIAEKHGIAKGSVGVYIKRALDRLRPILGNYI